MNALIRLGFFALMLVGGGASGQSNLPDCVGPIARWSNCFGKALFTTDDGTKLAGVYHLFEGARFGIYAGEFKEGKFEGNGTLTFAGGRRYEGQFKDDKFNGLGTLISFNGRTKYSGMFKDGLFNGQGTLFDAKGSVINKGNWSRNNFAGTQIVEKEIVQPAFPSQETELSRLRSESEEVRRKQAETEQALLAQQQTQQVLPATTRPNLNARNDRRVALVIGNATYKNSPLRNPVNDSNDMAQSLKAVGFDVVQINNATLAQMREATRRFADKLALSDVGLVYYSGHGLEVKGKNYLVPVNADITREYEVADQAFDASQFLEMMESIRLLQRQVKWRQTVRAGTALTPSTCFKP
jgi:hypothetical protein